MPMSRKLNSNRPCGSSKTR